MADTPVSDFNQFFVGLDVGSTTTSLLVASARLVRNSVTGRTELGEVQPVFRPEPVFTPFLGESLDIRALAELLANWLDAAALDPASVVAGGALVTELAARATNASAVTRLVKERFHQAVVARADDPCLESWLAFMGNTLGLSRAEPGRDFINLDIGGGTTNIAWGRDGEVRRSGCYFVGARHFQVEPRTYRLRSLSSFARELLAELGFPAQIGDELSPGAVTAILDFYVHLLEAAVSGERLPLPKDSARHHCQVEFTPPSAQPFAIPTQRPILTLSGGVGELAYRCARGVPLPATTTFGDLGIDLARRICVSPILGHDLATHVPDGLGRATVYGLAVHGTEISGATLFLPRPELLPLTDLPILGSFSANSSTEDLETLLALAARTTAGACLQVRGDLTDTATVKNLGERLAAVLELLNFPADTPLVLLVTGNIGKTLGQYATRWGRRPASMIVLDELPDRPAHFASIGKPCQNLIPVAFHGWEGDAMNGASGTIPCNH